MAPRTRKQVAKRRTNNVLRDADGMEENGQRQIEKEPEVEVSQQPIQKQGVPPSTKRAAASRDASSVFQDKQKMAENRQSQNFPQASREEQGTGLRTRKGIGNQSMSHRLLEEMDHMEGDGLHGQNQNEEELEFLMARQTNGRQVMAVMAPRSQRSTVNRRPNYVFSDEHEMEEGSGQQENEEQSNLEVAEALKNALQILTASSTRRAATNQRFQDTHQREENRQWQSTRQMQPPISQQVSIMPPTNRKATRSHIEYNILRDEIQIEGDEEQPEYQMNERVTAPSTQRSTAKRKLDDMLLDEDEIDGQRQQGNEHSNLGITPEIENALKILMEPSTRRAITNLSSKSRFRDTNQMKENGQLQSRKQLQPEFSHQTSLRASRNRKATTVQSGYHRLRDEDQLERDGQNGNEEQPQFQATRQTKDKQVMTRSTRRSGAGVNHGLLDEDEIEEHGQQENEQLSDEDVSQAIENALKLLMTPSTRKETANENSHCGFQDRHQMESRQEPQLQVSQQASISAVMPPRTQNKTGNESSYHSLEDEDQIEGEEEQQNEEPVEIEMAQQTITKKGTTRKPRGPTLLRDIWGRNPDEEGIKIHFNKRGQPVGPNKKKFTGFLGTLARNGRYAPLDIDDWRKVPMENKDAMLKLVKERFEVPEGMEHWILLSIGRKRNDWRARVKSQYLDPTLPIEDQIRKIPPRVTKEQWKNLCSYWANEDKMEECRRNRANRMQSLMHKTTGKLSFAEIEEEMRERLGRSPTRVEMFAACFTRHDGNPSSREVAAALDRMKEYQSKLPEDSPDPVRPDDTFAKVIGNDPPGKIRMLGLGVNQSDFRGATPSRGTCYKLVMEHQAKMSQMEEKMEQFTKLVGSLQEKLQVQQNPNNVQTKRTPLSPGHSSNSNIVGHNLQVGGSVVLKSLFDQKKIVAKGCLESVNPDRHVGGRRLGSNWYGVQIAVPIEWDEDLIRPFSNFSTIGDAIGTCVAWPHHLVTNEDNQE